jgi:hypothetical protein
VRTRSGSFLEPCLASLKTAALEAEPSCAQLPLIDTKMPGRRTGDTASIVSDTICR